MVQLYNPHPAGAAVLVRAMEFIRSVPYTVSARWLFYQLLQASVYSKKEDYRAAFLPLLSRARKGFYAGWAPNTLADDTRETVYGGFGYPGAVDWLERSVYSQGGVSSSTIPGMSR